MESLRAEVEPFGIHTTIVNPGFFRTELLTKESMTFAGRSVEHYAGRRAEQTPPRRFLAGADAMALAEQKVADLEAQIDAWRELSTSLAFDQPAATGSVR